MLHQHRWEVGKLGHLFHPQKFPDKIFHILTSAINSLICCNSLHSEAAVPTWHLLTAAGESQLQAIFLWEGNTCFLPIGTIHGDPWKWIRPEQEVRIWWMPLSLHPSFPGPNPPFPWHHSIPPFLARAQGAIIQCPLLHQLDCDIWWYHVCEARYAGGTYVLPP